MAAASRARELLLPLLFLPLAIPIVIGGVGASVSDHPAAYISHYMPLEEPFFEDKQHTLGHLGHFGFPVGNMQELLYLVFHKAFHGRGVIAQGFSHPHDSGKSDHYVTVHPKIKSRLDSPGLAWSAAQEICDIFANSIVHGFISESMLLGQFEHLVQIAILPSLRIAARHHHDAGFADSFD